MYMYMYTCLLPLLFDAMKGMHMSCKIFKLDQKTHTSNKNVGWLYNRFITFKMFSFKLFRVGGFKFKQSLSLC